MTDEPMIEIGVYPMVNEPDGGSRLIEGREEKADFYDVMVMQINAPDANNEELEEFEDLTLELASRKLTEMEAKYPNASSEWIYQ